MELFSSSLSFSKTFPTTTINTKPKQNHFRVSCSYVRAPPGTNRRGPSLGGDKKRHWKQGEFPGKLSRSPRRGPIKNIKKKLDDKEKAKAWVNTVTEALSDRILKKQWQDALQVFQMLKEQPFYSPKQGTYMKLLVLLGKCRQPYRARKLFDEMLEECCEPTSELYTALLASYCRNNLVDEAFAVLDEMKTLPQCQPDVFTYSTLIKVCVDECRFELVDSLYEEMAERGYGNAGIFHKVVSSVQLAEKLEIPENTSFYNAVLSACAKAEDLIEMERVFKRMKDKLCAPDSTTHSIMIEAYRKEGMNDKIYDLEQENLNVIASSLDSE
ncbi:hypothetical protein IFM89_016301 [Coptis chinensis]|uniref:Pentatricopeptide repeat-containing protein n=1 Tax=Coptis chinensis TaxID=261450 RepID=A0A835LI74_9MAGN|nr:hypothetical protein IFM89_016301 [Coptis chinensis]